MSLTRAEWEQMWEAIKRIENAITPPALPHVPAIKKNVAVIKTLIQQVIGQME